MRNTLTRIYSWAMAIVLLLPHSLQAQDRNAPLPTDPKVTIGQFSNGLKYYIRTNGKPAKKVELRLVVNAGSILEDADQQGLAHFMEHMNFNGTTHFQKNDLVSYLQSIGVQFGADLNAYTSFDETVYILPIPTDKEGNLEKGFQILEDWAHNALLTDKDIDDERAVVLEESRLGKGADMRMLQKYLPEMMSGSLYAERLPIGKDDILKNFKYDVVRRFYRDWYRPNLMAVAVVGDIDQETAMKYLKKYFEPMKNPATPRERFSPAVAARNTSKAMVLTDKEATGYELQIVFPSMKKDKEVTVNDYRHNMVRGMMTQIINQRLGDLASGSNPPFPYAYAFVGGWARGYENLIGATIFGEEGPEKALMALTAELKKAKEFGFTETEAELARKNMMSFMEKAYNERNTTESNRLIGEYVRNFLQGEPIPGIEKEYEYYKSMLPGITVAELNAEVKKVMENMNFFSLITGPEGGKTKLPTDAELLAMTQKGFAQQVKANEEKKVASNLLDKAPTPGKIVSVAKDPEFEATTYTLSNGIKVTVRPTTFKSDEILLRGVKFGGRNGYTLKDIHSADYAAAAMEEMGYGQFTPADLKKVLAGKSVSIGTDVGTYTNTVSGSTTVKDMETMFQLLYLQLTQPRKDEALFKAFVEKQKTQLQFMSANPQYSFMDTMYSVFFKNNPLRSSPIPKVKDFEDINLNRAMEIYKNELGTADGYHFFVVGNVEEMQLKPLLETYVASLPKSGKSPELKDNGVRRLEGKHTFKYNKGNEPKSLILAFVHGEAKYSEDFALHAQALAEILNIRVIEELREKLGGIYSGGYRANVSKEPYENFSLSLSLPCGPENVDKLLAAADEVVADIRKNGPKQEDLDKVKSQWHEKNRENREKNGWWSGTLESVMFWGRSRDNKLKYDQWIDKVTVKDVQNAANKMFAANSFTAVLNPEGEKK